MPKRTHPQKAHWSNSPGAKEHIIRLLNDSGALLEAQVAEVCQQFVNDAHKKKGVRVSTESITYGDDTEESPLRQIDQRVQLYKEFILDERTGVQWILSLPIEAKYRKDIEVFGVGYPRGSYRPQMPMAGFLHGSRLSLTLRPAKLLERLPLIQPIFLEIAGGATPRKVHEESLPYNAAGALYDFVRFDLQEKQDEDDEKKTIGDMRLIERFDRYLSEHRYAWWTVIYDWMWENLSDVLAGEFNKRIGTERVFYALTAHVPVFCSNGPLWTYSPPNFEPRSSFLTRVEFRAGRAPFAGHSFDTPARPP